MSQALLSRLQEQMEQSDTRASYFVSSNPSLESMVTKAYEQLHQCLEDNGEGERVLLEGGIYRGTWLESTGTINAEILSRFLPQVAEATFELFAMHQRSDGLIPYKWTTDGPAYRQIQLVTPLARSVWNHYLLNGKDQSFLQKMYQTMTSYDTWLATFRNTRETGCVEAFSTFDTGHDLSPRFWHVPDAPHGGDAASYHPDSPILPFLAPDLTANVYCQRKYLAMIAEELGEPFERWNELAEASLSSLMEYCYDENDQFFYDRDKHDQLVKVQSDVLLRVLACEVGDEGMFAQALERYLLNTRKFFAKYPFPSIALDDPRFDPTSSAYNSWSGTTNFLTLIRIPHAFEHHGHVVELTWVLQQILSAFSHMDRFPQTMNPWTGEAGFTEVYSPSILCLLNYIERLSGILPRPNGEIWATGVTPYPYHHEDNLCEVAYHRRIDGDEYTLVNTDEGCTLYKNEEQLATFPAGIRLILSNPDDSLSIVGMSARTITDVLMYQGVDYPFEVKGNEELRLNAGKWEQKQLVEVVYPRYE